MIICAIAIGIIILTAGAVLVVGVLGKEKRTPWQEAEAEYEEWLANNLQRTQNPTGQFGSKHLAEMRRQIYAKRGLVPPS